MRSRKKAGSDPRIPVLAGMIILLVLAAGTAGILIHRSNERRAEETAAEAEKETEPEVDPEQETGLETKTEERQAKIVADTLPNETKAPDEVPELAGAERYWVFDYFSKEICLLAAGEKYD